MKHILLFFSILVGVFLPKSQINLGSGTVTGRSPIDSFYGFTYSQQIFTKSAINALNPGSITGLKFYLSPTASLTSSNEWVVYMGTTTKTVFSSTTDYIPLSSLTQVFSGTITNNAGTVTITLATPFAYNNLDNLVVAVDENKAGYNGSSDRFYVFTGPTNSVLRYISDSTNPDPVTPPSGELSAEQSNVTLLGLTPNPNLACPQIVSPSNGATNVSLTPSISWVAQNNATGYKVSIGTTVGGTDIVNNFVVTNASTYNVTTPLQNVTTYYVTITSYNATNTSLGCTSTSFTTKGLDCPVVTQPLNNEAGVSTLPSFYWNTIAGATDYKVNVGTTPGGTQILNGVSVGTATNYTMTTPLANNTTYYVSIIATNAAGLVSTGCAGNAFITLCGSVTTFTENFETTENNTLPPCWVKLGTSGSVYVQTDAGISGSKNLYIYSSSLSSQATVKMPPVSNASAGTHRLRFKLVKNSTAGGVIQVGYLTNPSLASSFVAITSFTAGDTPVLVTTGAISAPAGVSVLALRHTGSPSNSVKIDEVTYEPVPNCPDVISPVVGASTTTSVSVSWTAPATLPSSGYQIYYSTSATAPNASTVPQVTNVTGTSTTITGLNPTTLYYIWIRSNCGASGFGSWILMGSTNTQCTAANVPYYENFNSVSPPVLPICTSVLNAGSGNNWNTSMVTSGGFSSNVLSYFYNFTNAANTWFFTRGVNLTAGTSYRISYKYASSSSFFEEKLKVAYGTSATVAGMTNQLANYPNLLNNTAQTETIDFVPTTSGVFYFGFNAYSIANQFNIYVDDIAVEFSPSCLPPSQLTSSNTTTTSSLISWTAPVPAPSSYEIYYSTSATAPTASTAAQVVNITGTSYTLIGLTPGTQYYVWVRSKCGANSSSWTNTSIMVTTQCSYASIPYTENFESATVPNIPICMAKTNPVGSGEWNISSNPSTNFPGKVAEYTSAGNTQADAWLFTQGLQLQAGVTYRLKYKYGNNSASYLEEMEVKVGNASNPAAMSTLIINHPAIYNADLNYASVDFTVPSTGVYYLGYHCISDPAQSKLFLDDIQVNVASTCPTPTNVVVSDIAASAFTVSWAATTPTPASYDVYVTSGTALPTSSTAPTVSNVLGTSTVVSGLTPGTSYRIYVRAVCSGNTPGDWSISNFLVTTFCGVSGVPYNQNFESATIPGMPPCTSNFNAGSGNNWVTQNNPGNGFTSNTLVYNYSASSAANTWFFTSPIQLEAGVAYKLQFRYGASSSSYIEKLKVSYGTANTVAGMTTDIISLTNVSQTTPQTGTYIFTPTTSGIYYLGFNCFSNSNQFNLYVDDIALTVNVALGTQSPQIENHDGIVIYPNPFRDVINIKNAKDISTIHVIDLSGRLLKTIQSPENKVNLETLSSGAYILQIIHKNGEKRCFKILKQ